MLEALQARRKDVDARIHAIELLMADKLDTVAAAECRSLLATYGSKPLSDAQRAAILTLQAELAVRANQPAKALAALSNVQALYPQQADPVKTKLIMGEAKLRSGGAATAEGLALLKELAAQGDVPAAATAQWELIGFDLGQGTDAARTAVLAKWLADHPKHFRADEARQRLLTAYLTLATLAGPPRSDSPLGDNDLAALAVAGEIIKQSPRSEEQTAVVQKVWQHLATRYTARQAYAATAAGLRKLLALPLPIYETSRSLGHPPLYHRQEFPWKGNHSHGSSRGHQVQRTNCCRALQQQDKGRIRSKQCHEGGEKKVMMHLMFGVVALFADQLLKLAT